MAALLSERAWTTRNSFHTCSSGAELYRGRHNLHAQQSAEGQCFQGSVTALHLDVKHLSVSRERKDARTTGNSFQKCCTIAGCTVINLQSAKTSANGPPWACKHGCRSSAAQTRGLRTRTVADCADLHPRGRAVASQDNRGEDERHMRQTCEVIAQIEAQFEEPAPHT